MIKAISCLRHSSLYKPALKHLQEKAKTEGFNLCYFTFNQLLNVAEFIIDNPAIQAEGEAYKQQLFSGYSPYEYGLLWRIVKAIRSGDSSELESIQTEVKHSNQRVRRVLSNFLIKNKIKEVFNHA